MSFLSKLSSAVMTAFELSGRSKTLSYLNSLGDSQLEDLGFSRELMNQGLAAFPWKAQDFDNLATLTETRATSQEIKEAIAELQAYNDRDLADIGIARYEIEDAVINGRNDDSFHAA
ncbi:DUF1127 domain-containing protein [Leucothrix arctica]|uniref:YjiS-like domain-containing protein n=1 Tax=Leucothrix arctica TaxID=1481894 RepID=A0A317C7F9_9GAMM|nr:DUF1127 domain-containing protein [Leucothrix arctica]PWQ94576.1 hypothetical protein DKT75_14870 [Leucothrix arctica]